MSDAHPSAPERILEAARAIAAEHGTAHMSLDAVAARAGVSKGGLLYHFPSKAKLFEAIVEDHVRTMKRRIATAVDADSQPANALARAFVEAFAVDCHAKDHPPAGILAAIAENPEFIDPIRRFQREIVAQFRTECADPRPAIVAFLAIEGIRCLNLFDAQVLDGNEQREIAEYLRAML